MFRRKLMHPMPAWRHVLVTGGAQGLGRAIARQCVEVGMEVTLLDCDADTLTATVASLQAVGGCARGIVSDVGDDASVRRAFREIGESSIPPDALLCCAAVGDGRWKRTLATEYLSHVLNINLLGIARCVEHALPLLRASSTGTIVLIGSLLDARGYAGTASYSVSKAALRAMADSIRVLLRPDGIRVVLVRPGFLRTAMATGNSIAMPGMLSAEDAAARILRGVARGREVLSFPWAMALLSSIGRMLPRRMYEAAVRKAMRLDGDGDLLKRGTKHTEAREHE